MGLCYHFIMTEVIEVLCENGIFVDAVWIIWCKKKKKKKTLEVGVSPRLETQRRLVQRRHVR